MQCSLTFLFARTDSNELLFECHAYIPSETSVIIAERVDNFVIYLTKISVCVVNIPTLGSHSN